MQNDDVTTDDVSALESGIVGLHIDPQKKDEILENNWIIYNSVKNHINRHLQEKVIKNMIPFWYEPWLVILLISEVFKKPNLNITPFFMHRFIQRTQVMYSNIRNQWTITISRKLSFKRKGKYVK